jgi:hypothetical protein
VTKGLIGIKTGQICLDRQGLERVQFNEENMFKGATHAVSLRDNNVAQKASKMLSSYSSLQYKYFHIMISILCCV